MKTTTIRNKEKTKTKYDFSAFRMPINYIILSLMESGELTKLQNKWWHDQAKCTTNKKSHEIYTNDGLELNNLAGIFFVLIVGLILSLFVAIIEFCFKQHDPMKQHQKFKTKPATATAMNTLQGKPKLTIQEQRDFDNGRVTVSKVAAHVCPNQTVFLHLLFPFVTETL